MKKKFLLSFFAKLTILCLSAQTTPQPFDFAQVHTLGSEVLQEERQLNVYLPSGYHPDSATVYPVIYVLDGSAGEDFVHVAGLVEYVSLYQRYPASIVVGIANVDRQRDFTSPSSDSLDHKYLPTHGGSQRFMEFLEKEVFAYVEQHFNASAHRSLIGQSLGGLFATEVLFERSDLFDDYFIISPSLWWDKQRLVAEADEKLAGLTTKPLRIFLSVGQEHPVMNQVAEELAAAIRKINRPALTLYYRPNLNEDHATILHAALYDAFKTFHRADKSFTIAFGSCGYQEHPLPVFDEVIRHDPDLFVFLGDNIYGDTKDMNELRRKYQQLADNPRFQRLRQAVPIAATWDDHDYGWNDAGRHYPFKEASKEIFLNFWQEPADSKRSQRGGIYDCQRFSVGDKTVQLIILDTRTFRDDLLRNQAKNNDRRYFYPLDYAPHTTTDSTLLGSAQWAWLETQLKDTADVRIIASSTQFGIEYNGYESWANFPYEQQRMLDLIKSTEANGVVFISGDVHYAEVSKLDNPGLYPIYDITSSGLSSTWHFATPNANRIEGPVMDNHFGLLNIDFTGRGSINVAIIDVNGNERITRRIRLEDLVIRKEK